MEKIKRVSEGSKPESFSMNMDATFFFERAVQSLDRFHYDKALKYFRRAAEYEQENPVNHCNWRGFSRRWAIMKNRTEYLQEVLDQIDPDHDGMLFLYGQQLSQTWKISSRRKKQLVRLFGK